jgi:hypothetical protein
MLGLNDVDIEDNHFGSEPAQLGLECPTQEVHQSGSSSPVVILDVPHRSPAASEFGDEYHEEGTLVVDLPKKIVDYLDARNFEAYYVAADGNCLYRALTFGPEWSKHDLARTLTGSYLEGVLKGAGNVLSWTANEDQIKSIRKGKSDSELTDGRQRMARRGPWSAAA